MVLPFTAKSRFRKIFHFVPRSRFSSYRVVEEASVRRTLSDLQIELRQCETDIRGLEVKYRPDTDKAASVGEMSADIARLKTLDARRKRLEARQKRAIAVAKKCGFSFLEIYDSFPSETNQGEYQPLI